MQQKTIASEEASYRISGSREMKLLTLAPRSRCHRIDPWLRRPTQWMHLNLTDVVIPNHRTPTGIPMRAIATA